MDTGNKFPDFELQNQNGQTKTLKDYLGSWSVFYVYPKDDTPGCTLQGKSFTTTQPEFDALGVNVVGISADSVDSHKSFCAKHGLKVELLADPDNNLLSQLGIEQKNFGGNQFWDRSSFLVDPEGITRKIYLNVDPEGHEKALLEDIRALQ